jgi:hypothetical protein
MTSVRLDKVRNLKDGSVHVEAKAAAPFKSPGTILGPLRGRTITWDVE